MALNTTFLEIGGDSFQVDGDIGLALLHRWLWGLGLLLSLSCQQG